MKVLLDTHVLLWLVMDDPRLSHPAREVLVAEEHKLYFSIVSLWEITIKQSINKLELAEDWLSIIKNELAINSIKWLSITTEHCDQLSGLAFHHRDPFDRMLIAQAIEEDMTLMSRDEVISNYPVQRLW